MANRLSIITLLITGLACAQGTPDDLRDEIIVDGEKDPVFCRVVERYGEGAVVIAQGGRVREIPGAKVRIVSTVNDRLRAFLDAREELHRMDLERRAAIDRLPRRDRGPKTEEWLREQVDRAWRLVGRATEGKLDAMARLQALEVLHLEPEHAAANEFLGHQPTRRGWRWPLQSAWLTAKDHARQVRKRGLTLESEHYRLTSDGPLHLSVATLFDLELFYLAWHERYGPVLRTREVLSPLAVRVARDERSFPKLVKDPLVYLDTGSSTCFTWLPRIPPRGSAPRPIRLFEIAAEQLLYTLLPDRGGIDRRPDRLRRRRVVNHRDAVWLEIGLGAWLGSRFGGVTGHAGPVEQPPVAKRDARVTLVWIYEEGRVPRRPLGGLRSASRWRGLENLIGWHFSTYYSGSKTRDRQWAATRAFVAFLLDPENGIRAPRPERDTRSALLDYTAAVYRDGLGNTSKDLDRLLGVRIERLEGPWIEWMKKHAR